jgi:hypothetical protein
MNFRFKRFVSQLVLISFFVQTIWPSMAFATEVDVLRPSSPLGFRFGASTAGSVPQLDLEVLSYDGKERDDGDSPATPPRSLIQRRFQPTDLTTALVPFLAALSVYGHLQVKTEGIEWLAQGLQMTITWQGELLARGQRGADSARSIYLENPHKVYLGEGLVLSALKVMSPQVVNLSTNTAIDTLEIFKPAVGDHVKEVSLLHNTVGAKLTVKQAFMSGFQVQNDGVMEVMAGGEFNCDDGNVHNSGYWQMGEGAKISHVQGLVNTGRLAGEGRWSVEEAGLVANYGEIGKGRDTLLLKSGSFHNHYQVNLDQLEAQLQKGGENHGQITTVTKTDVTCLGDWRQGKVGLLRSQGIQSLSVLGNLYNEGQITAVQQMVKVFGVTYNKGIIEGQRAVLDLAVLQNEGTLGAEQSLILRMHGGINKGEISSQGTLALEISGEMDNEGSIGSKERAQLTIKGRLTNKKDIVSEAALETSGEGTVINQGTVQGKAVSIGHGETDNQGLMVGQAVHLRGGKRFHNHATGFVLSRGGELRVSGKAEVINDAGTGDKQGFSAEEMVFDGYEGALTNGGRVTAKGQIRGALAILANRGLIEAGKGYQLTIQSLVNAGLLQGGGVLSVGVGENLSILQGSTLRLNVEGAFVNKASGSMDIEGIAGQGAFKNEGKVKRENPQASTMSIGVKVFENHARFEPGKSVTFTDQVTSWLNSETSVIETDILIFAQTSTLSRTTLNQGVLTLKQLALERSFENEGTLKTRELKATAAVFINHAESTLEVLGASTFQLQQFTNHGDAVFHQAARGTIGRLVNESISKTHDKGKETEGARLTFKALNGLRGQNLVNNGELLALQDLGWQGDDIENKGILVTQSTALGFSRQFVNSGLWRWSQGDIEIGGRHLLNLNTLEKRADLSAAYSGLAAAALPTDRTTTFKAGVIESRGQWLGAGQRIKAQALHNSGYVDLDSLVLEVDSLANTKSLQVRQSLTGRADKVDNHGTVTVLGMTDLRGVSLTNYGEINSQEGMTYIGATLHNFGRLLTPQTLKVTLSGMLVNKGTLQADGGFDWKIRGLEQTGKIIGHLKKKKSTVTVTSKIETGKESDWQLHSVDLTAQEWEHEGTLSLASASSLKTKKFVHKGVIAAVESVYENLEVIADHLTLAGTLSFYDLVVKADQVQSTDQAKVIAGRKLSFQVRGDYHHWGLLQARELEYRGAYRFSSLYNHGTILSSSETLIYGRLENKRGGKADLTGLTLEDEYFGSSPLHNEGTLRLARIQSLGGGLREILNNHGATLSIEDCGYSSEGEKGRELRGGGFAFGKATNYGTINFGTGTYHIRGDFLNYGTHNALGGQDLWYYDLINHGEVHSSVKYHIDHTRGKVTKLGKVRIKGELFLQLGSHEDAAEILRQNDIVSLEKARVEAQRFTNPYTLNLPGVWEFNVRDFSCPGKLNAKEMRILAASFETGSAGQWGVVETTDGILDVWVRKFRNTHGHVFGKRKTKIVVEDHDLENGAAVDYGDTPPAEVKFRYGRNGASISSSGEVEIEVKNGHLYNTYGTIFSSRPFDIKVKGTVLNKAGWIYSDSGGKIQSHRLEVTRETPGAEQYVSHSYQVHRSSGGWFNRSEWTETVCEYSTRYWEQSVEGIIDVTKKALGATGNLDLDCVEVFVTASSLLASGYIWSVQDKEYITPWGTLPSRFHVHERNGHAGKLAALEGVRVVAGSAVFTGSATGRYVHINSGDLLVECTGIPASNAPKMFITLDLVKLLKSQATAQGFIQDRAKTTKGKPRYGFAMPVDQTEQEDKGQLVYAGSKPQDPEKTEFAVEAGLVRVIVRQLMSHYQGVEGLRDDLMQRFHVNARKTGAEVMKVEDIEKQIEAMLVYKVQRIYDALYDIAHRADQVQEELHPTLVLPPSAQSSTAEKSGVLLATQQDVQAHADRSATFLSSHVEGQAFDITSGGTFHAETKKRVVIERSGDTVTTREILMPQAVFIGHHQGRVVTKDHYEAVGTRFATGAGGGVYECTEGDKIDRPAIATTTTETTHRQSGRRVLGFSVGGGRTTVTTTTHQEALATAYESLGSTDHRAPLGTQVRVGVSNVAAGPITFTAQQHQSDAAVAVHTRDVQTTKETVFGGSEHQTYQDSATLTPNITRSGTGVVFEGGSADLKAEVIEAPRLDDKLTGRFKLGMAKRELAHRSSSTREHALGSASVETVGGQETGAPSMVRVQEWVSAEGDTLIFESVIADQIGTFYTRKDFKQQTTQLKAWQQTTRESSGFCAPILQGQVRDPLAVSIGGFGQAQGGPDKIAEGMRMTSEGLRATTDGFKILQALKDGNPLTAAETLLGRYTSISFNARTGEASERQAVAQPNVLNFEVLVLANKESHLEGHLQGKKIVAFCDRLTTGPMVSTAEAHQEDRGGGVSTNLLTLSALPTVSVHESAGHTEQKTHTPTTINVDQLFVRVNHAVFSGTQIQAKIVDAIIKGSLTLESVLDTFRSSHSSLDLSTIGDVRVADREVVKEKVNQIANLVGTQQFYLQVGETLLTRSAEYGLKPDGAVVDTLTTADGQTFYPRPIPEEVENPLAVALGLSDEEEEQFFKGGDIIAELTEVATAKKVRIVGWEKNARGVLECLCSVGPSDGSDEQSTVHVLKTEEHYDLLETDPSRVEASAFQHEQLQERDEEDSLTINMPVGTALALAAQISELQQLRAQLYEGLKEDGLSDREALEAVANPEVQSLAKEVAAVTQELERELTRHTEEAAVKSAIAQSSRGGGGAASAAAASGTPVDPALYEDITRRAQVDSPLRDLPLGSGSGGASAAAADQPASYGQAVLEGLGYLKDRLERFIEKNPRMAAAGEVLMTSLGYCLESAVILKAGIDGAAAGGAVGGYRGAILGGAAGMLVAYGAGQAVATAVEAGADQSISAAAAQGRTAGESARFAATAEWAAKSAMTLAMLAGARKAANRWNRAGIVEPGVAQAVESTVTREVGALLPGEGRVGTFKQLDKIGKKGDNLTPDHMPQSAYMQRYGTSHQDGVAMMTEHPVPGVGGRHRMTRTYGRQPDLSTSPRQELAKDIVDRRNIYRRHGVYTSEIRQGLKEVIQKNKDARPDLFLKGIE